MACPDGGVVEFDVRLPVDDSALVENVRSALERRLPELRDFEYPWRDELTVVANGPSARDAPLTGKTAAINGALRLFTDQGLAPTYWIACDPQELVVDFLKEAPKETTYLVASKCHPAVFDRLKDHNVIVWHVDDTATRPLLDGYFPCGRFVSVTATSFEVWARLGWRRFHVWGWDCSMIDGAENAVPQANDGSLVDVSINDVVFKSTTNWALEAQDALSMIKGFPFHVTFHGGGMMGPLIQAFLPMKIAVAP